jgi:glycerol-3-phosphate dehydrogenase
MQEKLPGINPKNLTGGVRYFDGLTDDSRLVIDTLRSAGGHGAVVRNYTSLVDSQPSGSLWLCQLRDQATGQETQLKARAVVNAAGCWANRIPHSHVRLRLTKGIHFVVDQERFPVPEATVMSEGKRILFAIPWGERVIVGTTDTDYDGSLEDVHASAEDLAYVLRIVNETFPNVHLAQADILSHWAGVRPLIASGSTKRGTPSDTSRNHQIRMPEPGWIDVAGGKLTTYRLMAEQTVDLLGRHLGQRLPKCRTADEAILPTSETEGLSGVIPPQVTRAVVEHACRQQWAVHLDDVMLRRTRWQYYHRNADEIARQTAAWMAELLGWTPDRTNTELARLQSPRQVPTSRADCTQG